MKVLVTGATGFTGGALAARLLEAGDEVRVIVRDPSRYRAPSGQAGPEVVTGDIRDPDAVGRAVAGVEVVYHVAAVYRAAGIPDEVYRETHVVGTENLLRAAREAGVRRFVHCSTVGVHGHIEEPPADEDYRFRPGDIYQETKLAGERAALEFHRTTGLPVAVIRPTAIYGPGDLRLLKLFRLAAMSPKIVLGDGTIRYHMVHVDDLIQSFRLAAEVDAAVGRPFIVGGEEVLSLDELIAEIAGILGRPGRIVHVPAAPVQWLGSACEAVCRPLRIAPPIYRRRVDFFTKSRWFRIDRAKEVLGYRPSVPLREGLESTARWCREEGHIS